MIDNRTKSTICVKSSQIGTYNLYDFFVEIVILLQDLDFNLSLVDNDSRQHPIIWHFCDNDCKTE
jgi:hypothetical protein